MPTLRELSKRLKSAETAGELAGAMRTVAAAKYSRVNSKRSAAAPYAEALCGIASCVGGAEGSPAPAGPEARKAFVVFSGNHGLCGGYDRDLFLFFEAEVLKKESRPIVIVCGKKAAEYFREKKIPVEREFVFGDVPSFSEARELSGYLGSLAESGSASSVDLVYRRFVNMLRQPCGVFRFLPSEDGGKAPEDVIFIPDRETVTGALVPLSRAAGIYDALLSCASGAQAATLMAMRSAYDNSQKSKAKLETEINRLRQAGVTKSVLETAAEIKE